MPSNPPFSRIKPFKYVDMCQSQSSGSLGDLKIGRVRVDCCFLMSKTQWGELQDKDSGLMYLDLTFHQPSDCKLAEATITMDFQDTEDYPLWGSNLEVTEFFGPRALSGEKREQQVSKTFETNPKIGAASVNAEGIGMSTKSEASFASRWKFTGSRFAAESDKNRFVRYRNSRYRQLVWQLEENELERQAVHHSTVHTALAFHHDSRPFFLDLQIQIKMQRWHHRFRQKLICPPRSRKSSTRTKIEPGRITKNARFPQLARAIDQAMTEANLYAVAEVPDPQPASSTNNTKWDGVGVETLGSQTPSEALIALAQHLTRHEHSSSSTVAQNSSSNSTCGAESSCSTLVEPESGERIETKAAMAKTSNSLSSVPTGNLTKCSALFEHGVHLIMVVVRETSQFLATLIALLILCLSQIQSFLAQAAK